MVARRPRRRYAAGNAARVHRARENGMIRSAHALYFAWLYLLFAAVTLLVFLTAGNRRFVKRKIAVGTLILSLAGPVLSAVSCKNAPSVRDVWSGEGWVGDDTYRVIASGEPAKTLTNKTARKESAKRAAVLNAQYRTVERFRSALQMDGCCYSIYSPGLPTDLATDIRAAIKGGTVIAAKYGEEESCSIVFETRAKDLKKKVTNPAGGF